MIVQGSRYASLASAVYTITGPDGRQEPVLPIRFLPPTPAALQYVVQAGDRLDLLSAHYYGAADRFWLIADANEHVDPDTLLEPGRTVLVPPDRS
jgi:nucleoid-associated protein YgaU